MDRRTFVKTLGAALAVSVIEGRLLASDSGRVGENDGHMHASIPSGPPQQIAMLVYPNLIPLDLFGPHAVFAALGNVQVHLVWKTRDIVVSHNGIPIQPTATLENCPGNLDILFVPGGLKGTIAIMNDPQIMAFLQDRGKRARYVTSVCTGSLALGAAGLLHGYKATSHWQVRDLLPLLGAEVVAERVVEDRNRITGGGVTAGIDFGLLMAARLRSEDFAKMLQLVFEYDPQPSFHAGSPKSADEHLVRHLQIRRTAELDAARKAAQEAGRRLHL
jgi:cyclohexyl-isocyanide hydratase